jgi:uncharacterized protein
MIAVDSGFLFALSDTSDPWHVAATQFASTANEGWVTTWPVVAETCHLLYTRLNSRFVSALLDDLAAGTFDVWNPPELHYARIPEMMRKYASLPMDLADATLVLLAEHLGHGRILTTDVRDFGAYRWKSRKPFHNLLDSAP